MLWLAIILFMIAIVAFTIAFFGFYSRGKEVLNDNRFYYLIVGGLVSLFISLVPFQSYKHQVEDKAIKKFINNECMVYEKSIDGVVIERTYKLSKE